MRMFLVWKRRCANVRAGTQAPPLRVSFGWIVHGTVDGVWVDCAQMVILFGQIVCGMVGVVWGMDCAWPTRFGWMVDACKCR